MQYCIWCLLDQHFALELLSSKIEIKCVKKKSKKKNVLGPLIHDTCILFEYQTGAIPDHCFGKVT